MQTIYHEKFSYAKLSVEDGTSLADVFLNTNADYVRLEVNASAQVDKECLQEKNFIWVDRTVRAKISLNRVDGLDRLVRMEVRQLDEITEDVFEVAKSAFVKDRRFFLSLDYDKEIGHEVLHDYIIQYEGVPKKVFGCFYENKMVGALIAIQISETEYETVLGAILPEWQSKGVGVSLYAYEFDQLKKQGVKTLYSRISTDNVASLNLHISLCKGNLAFMQPLDVYIKSGKSTVAY